MAGRASRVTRVKVTGPLGPFLAGFEVWLAGAGYTPLSSTEKQRQFARRSRWLEAHALTAGDLTAVRREEFLEDERAGARRPIGARSLAPVLSFLSDAGVLPAEPAPQVSSPTEELLARYEDYLRTERGLVPSTAAAYVLLVGRFLSTKAPGGDLGRLTPAQVSGAVLAEGADHAVGSVQYFVAALRSFLRFAAVTGLTGADLSAAALTVTGRRTWLLPRGVSPAEVEAVLASCDRRRGAGPRDYAVLLVLHRLALRAGEVAALRLEDVDWRGGLVLIHGKGGRVDALPLPRDVGAAVAAYLSHSRPPTGRREVFLSAVAPVRPLTSKTVSAIVRNACVRAGVEAFGPHRLRHTTACDMLAADVPLPQIGQVLRHRDLASTATYARVDLDTLRRLARPWPGGGDR